MVAFWFTRNALLHRVRWENRRRLVPSFEYTVNVHGSVLEEFIKRDIAQIQTPTRQKGQG
jgi:hypothetical protein